MKKNKLSVAFSPLKKGDKIFSKDGDWTTNAILNFFIPENNLGKYADGYRMAADILIEYVKKHKRGQDYLIYPIASLYRHYIELVLKEIILKNDMRSGTKSNYEKDNHYLDKLWVKCRKIIENLWPKGPKKDLDVIEERINEFIKRDPYAMAFRYPEDKTKKQTHPDTDIINLETLSKRINEIAIMLSGTSDHLSYLIEMEQDYNKP